MPIRPEFRHYYQGPEWQATRARILERAGNCCEACRVPNHTVVARAAGWWVIPPELFWWHKPDETPQLYWTTPDGETSNRPLGFPRQICRMVYIVLTIAHLNHTPGDDRDENLKAWCQWCHLRYDERFHRQTRCLRKDAARPLLAEAGNG